MAMLQKEEKKDVATPAVPAETAPKPAPVPVLAKPPRANGGGLGFGGICMIVAAVLLLATIGSQFFAMKAMFVF